MFAYLGFTIQQCVGKTLTHENDYIKALLEHLVEIGQRGSYFSNTSFTAVLLIGSDFLLPLIKQTKLQNKIR